jgi:hypothetical protein
MTKLRAGDWVEVRSKEEILRTLDEKGKLDEMPFMPQMFDYCGKRFAVFRRAHKTCDTVNPIASRWVIDTVHLDLRCDGKAYGGCQAACLLFWKEAWLKAVATTTETAGSATYPDSDATARAHHAVCTEEQVWNAVNAPSTDGCSERYSCQATQLPTFTKPLAWWDPRQYVQDYTSGNLSLGRIFAGFVYLTFWHVGLAKRTRLGRPARWLYDWLQSLWDGVPFPRRRGPIPIGAPTPTCDLNLQPGEWVRVKPYKEILTTLDKSPRNRGMFWDAELVPYCGGTYRVRTRVTTFIDEKTGRLKRLATPAVILENVWCQSRYSNFRMFCPRAIFPWWREIWLERVNAPDGKLSIDQNAKEPSTTRAE